MPQTDYSRCWWLFYFDVLFRSRVSLDAAGRTSLLMLCAVAAAIPLLLKSKKRQKKYGTQTKTTLAATAQRKFRKFQIKEPQYQARAGLNF